MCERKPRKASFLKNEEAFALTQILILSIALAIGITSLISVALNRLTNTRIRTLEMQAKNAAESGIISTRALLNNSRGRVYYYFWLLKACAINARENECPNFGGGLSGKEYPGELVKGSFNDPSDVYWVNDSAEWCTESISSYCIGRQVAPVCNYAKRPIDWASYRANLAQLIDGEEVLVGRSIFNAKKLQSQSYQIRSIDFLGTEKGGQSSLLIEGITRPTSNKSITSANSKFRVNIALEKIIPASGFAFISAGENEADINSLYLGDLQIVGDRIGSIVWRKNIYNPNDCSLISYNLGLKSPYQIPDHTKNKGGLWVQPLALPPKPGMSKSKPEGWEGPWYGAWSLGQISCTPENSANVKNYNGSNCNFLATQGWFNREEHDRSVTIDDLFVKGEGATFDVITTDNSRVTMLVRGSIDISNGGKFCHREGYLTAKCGSGKPENLTILFEQPGENSLPPIGSIESKQEISCAPNGGIQLNNNNNYKDNVPLNTFLLSSTGRKSEDSFSAFIYAKDTTLTTSSPDVHYYQVPKKGSKLLVTARGVHAYLNDPEGRSFQDRAPRLLRTPENNLLPFVSKAQPMNSQDYVKEWSFSQKNGFYLIALGTRAISSSPGINSMLNAGLFWNPSINKPYGYYSLIGIDIKDNQANFVEENTNGRDWKIELGSNPYKKAPSGQTWLSYYNIQLKETSKSNPINIKGAAWMKNVCFDNNKTINWHFNKNFGESLAKRYDDLNYMYGVPYYRGKSILTWDTLRNFSD